MTVDLKIAEALGAFIGRCLPDPYYEYEPTLPCIVVQKDGSATYHFDMKGNKWRFDLTGPDAGNTAAVIKKLLQAKGFTVIETTMSAYSKPLTRIAIYDEFTSVRVFNEDHGKALREAAAKALKVEVEG